MPGSLPLPYSVEMLNPVPGIKSEGPWTDLASAKAGVPLAIRWPGLKVTITGASGGTYWWSPITGDLSDSGLVKMLDDIASYVRIDGTSAATTEYISIGTGKGFINYANGSLITFGPTTIIDGLDIQLNSQSRTYSYVGASGFIAVFDFTGLTTASKTYKWPNKSGTVALLDDLTTKYGNEIKGVIFSDNFSRANGSPGSNYSKTGSNGTYVITSNELVIANGIGTFGEYLDYSPYKFIMYKDQLIARYRVGTVNTAGIALGFGGSSDLTAWLDTTTSSASILRLMKTGVEVNYIANKDPLGMAVASGNVIRLSVVCDEFTVTVTAYNEATGASSVATYNSSEPIAGIGGSGWQRMCFTRVYSIGGTHYLLNLSATDFSPLNISALFLGDSITFGFNYYGPLGYVTRFIKGNKRAKKLAFPGATLQEMNDATFLASITSSMYGGALTVVLACATNDIAGGRTLLQIQTDYASIISTLEATTGVTVQICTTLPRVAYQSTIDTVNAWVISTYGSNHVIHNIAGLISVNELSDGTHPSAAGTDTLYNYFFGYFKNQFSDASYHPNSAFSMYPSYKAIPLATFVSTITATMTNTQKTIPINDNVNWPSQGYYLLTNGNGGQEIGYYNGLGTGVLLNCSRGYFGTTAQTIASTTGWKVSLYLSLEFKGSQIVKASTASGFNGFNCGRQLINDQEEFRVSLQSAGNPTVVWDAPNGGSPVHYYDKAYSFCFTQITFSTGKNPNFTITHGPNGKFSLGRYAINDLSVDASGYFGLGVGTASAKLHLPSTRSIAGGSPLKINFNSFAITGASGNGSQIVINFADFGTIPWLNAEIVDIVNMNPAGYNGTYNVVSSTGTSVVLTSTFTGTFVSGGTITSRLLTTPEAGAIERDLTDIYFTPNSLVRSKLLNSNGINIKEGANQTMGIGTLVAGSAIINTTRVTANSRIFIVRSLPGGTLGDLGEDSSVRVVGTSFTAKSMTLGAIATVSALDTSSFVWIIIEPN